MDLFITSERLYMVEKRTSLFCNFLKMSIKNPETKRKFKTKYFCLN